jgi:hypothetical protein
LICRVRFTSREAGNGETDGIEDRHPVILAHPGLPETRQGRLQLGKTLREETCSAIFCVCLWQRPDGTQLVAAHEAHREVPRFGGNDLVEQCLHSIAAARAHIAIFDVTNAGFGLLSSALVVGLSYTLISISRWGILNSYYGYNPVIEIIIPITILFLYVLLIFTPAIIMGARHGWRAFLSVLICEFLWYLIFLAIYFSFFFQAHPSTPYPYNSLQ